MLPSSTFMRVSTITRFIYTPRGISRFLSTSPDLKANKGEIAKAKGRSRAPIKFPVRPICPEDVTELGKQYNELIHKGRNGLPLGLSDLRKLLQQCESPDHIKYAVGAVNYYQEKGQDFAEDVNSLFFKACVKGENPMAAVELVLQVSMNMKKLFYTLSL